LLLETSPKMLEDNLIHLGCINTIMWLQGHHRSDRWLAPVRPVRPWETDFEPQQRISMSTFRDVLDMR
jgi:hypothetical protein